MGGYGQPFPTSNNAPQPIPGGYGGNYSGLNFGGASSGQGQPFPSMPAFGGPAYNYGGWSGGPGSGLAGMNAGLTSYGTPSGTALYNQLGKAYGKGMGATLGDLLSGQLYNPQVAAAFLNAQQPGIARGQANILGAFGDAGARFSSAAALGLGDYNSQVQLNQQQTLAQMYEQAQQQELGLLQNVLPTIQQEQANKGGWLNTVIGGLEIAGGVAIDVATGGIGSMLGTGLILGGANTLSHGHGSQQGGGGASSDPTAQMIEMLKLQQLQQQQKQRQIPPVPQMPDPSSRQSSVTPLPVPGMDQSLQMSGGGALGGSYYNPYGYDPSQMDGGGGFGDTAFPPLNY